MRWYRDFMCQYIGVGSSSSIHNIANVITFLCNRQAAPKPKRSDSWVGLLTVLVVVQTTAFVTLTVLQFQDFNDLEFRDVELGQGIQRLQGLINDVKLGEFQSDSSIISDGTTDVNSEKTEADGSRDKEEHAREKRQVGLFTEILKAQEAIFERHCHDLNKTCPAGIKGDTGLPGDKGALGAIGDQGALGQTGNSGKPGMIGEKGSIGARGSPGNPGTAGQAGTRGLPGVTGDPGVVGSPGVPGVTGIEGFLGTKGVPGENGINGTRGIPGNKGLIGDPGAAGTKGQNGDPGIAGLSGPDVKLLPDGCDCLRKPIFRTAADETITAGGQTNVFLPCYVTGNPEPVVSVRKDSSVGRRAAKKYRVTYPVTRQLVSSANNFTVSNAGNAGHGQYVCEAVNMFGTVTKRVTVQ